MTINLEGYVDVAERIKMFRNKHPEGSLQPADLDKPYEIVNVLDKTFIVYVALAFRNPDDIRPGCGVAWEEFPGRTPYTRGSELQNAETSAWGRAIMASLAADAGKIASFEEVRNRKAEQTPEAQAVNPVREAEKCSTQQTNLINKVAKDVGVSDLKALVKETIGRDVASSKELTKVEASKLITLLMSMTTAVPAE